MCLFPEVVCVVGQLQRCGWPFLFRSVAMPFQSLPGQPRMPFAAFVRTFKVTDRERRLLADGLDVNKYGVDPEEAFKLLQGLRR